MKLVRTGLGYEFEWEDDAVKVGDVVSVPIPTEEDPVDISLTRRKFAIVLFGHQKEWPEETMRRRKFPDGLERLPEEWRRTTDYNIIQFIAGIHDIKGYLNVHWVGKVGQSKAFPEVWFPCPSEGFARDLQYLWLRMGVRTSRRWDKHRKRWMVRTAGVRAYVHARPIVLKMKNPKIKAKIQALDNTVPFEYKMFKEHMIKDEVVEVLDVE